MKTPTPDVAVDVFFDKIGYQIDIHVHVRGTTYMKSTKCRDFGRDGTIKKRKEDFVRRLEAMIDEFRRAQ